MNLMYLFIISKQNLRLILFLLLTGSYAIAYSQISNSNFDHFTVRDGLPSEQLYSCCRDREGFLWIGTDAGVSRFDGKHFKNLTVNDGLGDNEIHEVYQDLAGRIWFIPFSGKLSYSYQEKIYYQDIEPLLEEHVRRTSYHLIFAEDASGNFYLSMAGSKKIIKLNGVKAKPTVYDLSRLVSSNDGLAAFYGEGRQVFCITSGRQKIALNDTGARNVTPAGFLQKEEPGQFYIHHQLWEGYLLFLGKEGIYKLQAQGAELVLPYTNMPFKNHKDFIQMKYDHFNNLWLSNLYYNTTFYKYTNGSYQEPVALLSDIFSITTCDEEQNIWFATSNGLYRTTYSKLQDRLTFDINNHLLSQKIISCAIDKDSGLWLGYGNGYVSRIKGDAVNHYPLKIERKTNNRVMQIKADSAGNLLLGTDETVAISYRLKPGIYSKPLIFRNADHALLRCFTKNIFFDNAGKVFLSEPSAMHLLHLDQKTLYADEQFKNVKWPNCRIFSGFFNRQNKLYISTTEGLALFEKGNFINLAKQDERFKVRVQDYAESRDGTVFLATYNNGLLVMRDKKITCAMPQLNNRTVICRRIYSKNDTLYVATNHGVGILIFAQGQLSLVKMLSGSDGLISEDVNDLAFLGNRLFVATSQGVSSFELPPRPVNPSSPPWLLVQSINVDDSSYSAYQPLQLSYKTRSIRINFIAPTLNKPELTLYRYRFNAGDEWQVTSANFVEFHKLKPGNYSIVIQAKKYNSAWSFPKSIFFVIKPPFYNTLWFICLASFIFIAGLSFSIKLLLDRKFRVQLYALQKKEAIERERSRIATDIHDDIGAELTNIVLLARILKNRTVSDGETLLKTVHKIETSSNQIITKMNEVIWTLNARDYTLKSLLSHIRHYVTTHDANAQARISMIMDSNTETDYPLTTEFTRNVFLVVKELLQNAIKHSKATLIQIETRLRDPRTLHIIYCDNGIGFDTGAEQQGNGLRNMKRRAYECKGSIEVQAAIHKGCQITIVFPLITS